MGRMCQKVIEIKGNNAFHYLFCRDFSKTFLVGLIMLQSFSMVDY